MLVSSYVASVVAPTLDTLRVIPGRRLRRTRNPGVRGTAVWIPGSREDARPGMTDKSVKVRALRLREGRLEALRETITLDPSTATKTTISLRESSELGKLGPPGAWSLELLALEILQQTDRSVSVKGDIAITIDQTDLPQLLAAGFDHLLVHILCPALDGRKETFWCEVKSGNGFANRSFFEADRRGHSFLIPLAALFEAAGAITVAYEKS